MLLSFKTCVYDRPERAGADAAEEASEDDCILCVVKAEAGTGRSSDAMATQTIAATQEVGRRWSFMVSVGERLYDWIGAIGRGEGGENEKIRSSFFQDVLLLRASRPRQPATLCENF